ncbi:MAG: D-alanyl-D-alanine carboxypeptidase/D-alanyl-D-alanine-endopeptidase [Planctomycetota bacterium]
MPALVGALLLALTAMVAGQTPSAALHAGLVTRLDSLLDQIPATTRIGLLIADAQTGAVLYARNADALLKPASVLKLFTTAAALERFGPDFSLATQAYLLDDELWIVGGGEPGLGDERLAARHKRARDDFFDRCAAALAAHGVNRLARIVLDDTIFDQEHRHPDWPADQADRWYQAPIGGLNVNDNCLDARVVLRGRDISVAFQPELPAEFVKNTLGRGRKQAPVFKRPPASDVFILQGTVSAGGELSPVAARDPTRFFGEALRHALTKRGVSVAGAPVRGTLPAQRRAGVEPLAVSVTALSDVLWRCNTFSQNLFAECLLKALPAYAPDGGRTGVAGSWPAGVELVQRTLAPRGVDLADARLRDGSGLSHENAVSARQVVDLLVQMRRHPHADVFLASLARAGEEGSMRNRYGARALRGRLQGKTGSIAGVQTLAGYITQADGRIVALAVLINGQAAGALPAELCLTLVE